MGEEHPHPPPSLGVHFLMTAALVGAGIIVVALLIDATLSRYVILDSSSPSSTGTPPAGDDDDQAGVEVGQRVPPTEGAGPVAGSLQPTPTPEFLDDESF